MLQTSYKGIEFLLKGAYHKVGAITKVGLGYFVIVEPGDHALSLKTTTDYYP